MPARALVLLYFLLFPVPLPAQADSLRVDSLPALLRLQIEDISVIGRRDERPEAILARAQVLGLGELQRIQPLSTADALEQVPGVFIQRSQFGGGSPVLRGFEANRVLLVVDGVRMNNAIYRSGHLQNAITVDPLALDRVEVLFGPGSLAYGSDALGGVVHFRTRQPKILAERKGIDGAASVGLGSAARSVNSSVRLEYGGDHWGGLTLLSTLQTAHLRSGAKRPNGYRDFGKRPEYADRIDGRDTALVNPNPNRQIGTAYAQYNLLQKFRFQLRDQMFLNLNLQASTTGDLPRYDNLTERRDGRLRWARWDYGPQTRTLAAATLQDRRPTRLYDVATYLLSHQYVREDRIRRRFGDVFEEHNEEDVQTINWQTDFAKLWNRWTLRYGLDARADYVASTAYQTDITAANPERVTINTRYPSQGSQLLGGGGYLDGDFRLNDIWQFRGGLRLAYQRLHARFGADDPVDWPVTYVAGVSNTNTALTGAVGLRRNGKRTSLRAVTSRGFRAPNVDDFGKFREQNGFLLIPNPALKPEYATTVELGLNYLTENRRLQLGMTVYYTWLRQAIIRLPATLPDGTDRLESFGELLQVQTNGNAERAWIYGLETYLRYQVDEHWQLSANFTATRGRREAAAPDGTLLTVPQDHIAPPFGSFRVHYERANWTAGFLARCQLRKPVADYAVSEITQGGDAGYRFNRLGTSDNLELTAFDSVSGRYVGALGWWTVHLYGSYQLGERWSARLSVDNLLDQHYRPFASGVSAPGLDIRLGLRYRFRAASKLSTKG